MQPRRGAHGASTVISMLVMLLTMLPGVTGAASRDEIIVTASGLPREALDHAGNTTTIGPDRLSAINASHPYEVGALVPGTWISRGPGQEHLLAIRSPVLTGPGSCGSFLLLEDGIATRPVGFCNVNQLFEIPVELAESVEVIRGPGNSLWGSNALHGTINVLLPVAGDSAGWSALATAGADRFLRGSLAFDTGPADTAVNGGLLVDRDGGFRNDSGYRQAKGYARFTHRLASGVLDGGVSGNLLDQETAGFIVGLDAYKDPAARLVNPNPESYRDADSQRAFLRYTPTGTPGDQWQLTGYARRSAMDFLQHFLPGQPVEKNGQVSGGLVLRRYQSLASAQLTSGIDLEYADGWLREFQQQAEVPGPPAARPAGKHYDYAAKQYLGALHAQLAWPLGRHWRAEAGARLEYLGYDYDNRMLDGNTRDDGTPCLPAGCLFSRPADRHDDFGSLAPHIGLLRRLGPHASAYGTLTRGFRAPQAAELYRLQVGQNVADLDTETIDSLEVGWRWQDPRLRAAIAAFAMRKDDYVLQDSNRFNVSGGRSDHLGLEIELDARLGDGWYASFAATVARQTYAFDRTVVGGEVIRDGKDIDTAPRTLGSLRLGYDAGRWLAETEWLHQGRYYLTAGEAQRYRGHELLNARAVMTLTPRWSVSLRVNNVLDELYADRADYAFGDYRYFPGRDRQAFVDLRYRTN